jgi:hypothetical protein
MPKIFRSQKGVIHFIPIIAIALLSLAVAASSQIKTVKNFTPTSKVGGVLLAMGDLETQNSESLKTQEQLEKKKALLEEEQKKLEEKKKKIAIEEEQKLKQELLKKSLKVTKSLKDSTNSAYLKIKDREKFATYSAEKNKAGSTLENISSFAKGAKVKFEIKNGEVQIEKETEGGSDLNKEDLDEIQKKLDDFEIKLSSSEGKILVHKNKTGALSNFPLQIDLETNQLIASTSAGSRVLTVLPDIAIQNMLNANVLTKITSTQIEDLSDVVELGEKNGIPVYKLKGTKSHKLFGFVPIETEITADVSAETGDLISTEQSVLSQVIDYISL